VFDPILLVDPSGKPWLDASGNAKNARFDEYRELTADAAKNTAWAVAQSSHLLNSSIAGIEWKTY